MGCAVPLWSCGLGVGGARVFTAVASKHPQAQVLEVLTCFTHQVGSEGGGQVA